MLEVGPFEDVFGEEDEVVVTVGFVSVFRNDGDAGELSWEVGGITLEGFDDGFFWCVGGNDGFQVAGGDVVFWHLPHPCVGDVGG